MNAVRGLPPEPYCTTGGGVTKTRLILIITGLYITLNSEATINELIKQWRARTGVDKPIPENFIRKMMRRWRGEVAERQGYIKCVRELEKDQHIFTAHFH